MLYQLSYASPEAPISPPVKPPFHPKNLRRLEPIDPPQTKTSAGTPMYGHTLAAHVLRHRMKG
jgi:hypothetical protein